MASANIAWWREGRKVVGGPYIGASASTDCDNAIRRLKGHNEGGAGGNKNEYKMTIDNVSVTIT